MRNRNRIKVKIKCMSMRACTGCMAHSMTVSLIVYAWEKFSCKNVDEMGLRTKRFDLRAITIHVTNETEAPKIKNRIEGNVTATRNDIGIERPTFLHRTIYFQSIEMSNKSASFVDLYVCLCCLLPVCRAMLDDFSLPHFKIFPGLRPLSLARSFFNLLRICRY